VLEAISTQHPGLIVRFGGHAMAAGLTLEEDKLDQFAAEFDREVTRWQASGSLADRIDSDGELAVEEISLKTAEVLREAGPWGQAFPEPSFDQSFRLRNVRIVGENHLKMWVELGDTGRRFDAIAFNALQGRPDRLDASGKPVLPDQVHLVYRLDINEWGGERRLQLMVDHLLESSP
jgi:single-stranded-DNA-specific exonuclease